VIKAIVIAVTSQGLATCVIDGGVFQRNPPETCRSGFRRSSTNADITAPQKEHPLHQIMLTKFTFGMDR
jgi:hypothetical protein